MEEKYYMIRAEIDKFFIDIVKYHGLSFVKLSDNKLEHIAGNDIVNKKIAEIKEGKLVIGNEASMKYHIQQMEKEQFEFHLDCYKKRLKREE